MTVDDLPDALAPVRAALLGAARTDADRELATAAAEAAAVEAAAREQAARAVEVARAEGEALGRALADRRLARARRDAREQVLAARSRRTDTLRRVAVERAVALRSDPDYPRLLAGLADLARERLGPDALVTESPAGGVVARSGSRQLDLSLPALAEQAVDAALAGVEP